MIREFEIELPERGLWVVEVEITECQWIDDSFDHEFGTEKCGHWEVVEYDILSCVGPDGEDEDPCFDEALSKKIDEKVHDMDVEDWQS